VPLVLLLAFPFCIVILAVRSHRQAVRRGQDLGEFDLALRLWAYATALSPIILALCLVAYLIGIVLFMDPPAPPQKPW
jgi:hypothetical protein